MTELIPLLETKLRIPPGVPALIPRPRLLERLDEGLRLGRQMTLISAPAGYGKTSLLSDWAGRCGRAVAWLALDEEDSDPARFLAYLTAALRRSEVIAGKAEPAGFASLQPNAAQAALPALLHEIENAGRAFVLMLDDYHLIQAPPVHDALTYLLHHQPPQMHLVIASRADPPLPLARLRARGQLTELRQGNLRFTPAEAAAFLNQVRGLDLEVSDVAALAARTEGWIAGLQLAATWLQARDDAHRSVRELTGNNRYILDYLVEQVLERQPRSVQDFMLQTSILDRLTGPLCDAVTDPGGEAPAAGSGQAMLERLERANLFIVPLDDERRWYRYHRLFADLLRKRLGQSRPEQVPALHCRASAWHERHGAMTEAVEHALAAGDVERAAQLIERIAEATLMRSEAMTLRKWIDALPEEQVCTRPLLCVLHAWVLLLGGSSLEAAEARLRQVQGEDSPLALPLWALVAYYRGDSSRAIELARRALEVLPADRVLLRGLATLSLAAAHHAGGDTAASQRMLQAAAGAGHATGDTMTTVAAACYRAELCRREGKLREARALYQQALDLATEPGGGRLPIANQALIGLGEIAREWNELDAATQHILEAIELAGGWAQVGALEAYITLARIRQAQGDWDGVQEALHRMRQIAAAFRASEVDDRLADMVEAWMQTAQGRLDGPRGWAERYGLRGSSDPRALEAQGDAARRLRKYEYAVAARLWIAEGRPAEALALLERALPLAEQTERIGLMIEYELLTALAAEALGRHGRAMQSLERALALGEPEGFVRIFLDEGAPLARLLHRAASHGVRPQYVGRLLAAFPPAAAPASSPQAALIEPLSERELEILRLIAEGLSNEEIAQKLVLSLATVKWHSSHIYAKLSVKNRTEAVAKARGLGLLPLA